MVEGKHAIKLEVVKHVDGKTPWYFGTLTLYLDGKPCGTIAEGLAGPLHWCITSCFAGMAVKIHAGLEIPPQ